MKVLPNGCKTSSVTIWVKIPVGKTNKHSSCESSQQLLQQLHFGFFSLVFHLLTNHRSVIYKPLIRFRECTAVTKAATKKQTHVCRKYCAGHVFTVLSLWCPARMWSPSSYARSCRRLVYVELEEDTVHTGKWGNSTFLTCDDYNYTCPSGQLTADRHSFSADRMDFLGKFLSFCAVGNSLMHQKWLLQ